MSEEFRAENIDNEFLKIRLLSCSIVDDLHEDDGSLFFELESESNRYISTFLEIVDSLVGYFYIDVNAGNRRSEVYHFIGLINLDFPFGAFILTDNDEIALKMYVFNHKSLSDSDFQFVLYWAADLIGMYKKGFEYVVLGLGSPRDIASKLQSELASITNSET